jgi:putative tryptophan/tyrosine transport system substrate-binding protein
MQRREFITLLGGAAVTWPHDALSQQPGKPIIAFLSGQIPPAYVIDAFRGGLNELGYAEGRDVAFEHHQAGESYERFRILAGDLVRDQVTLIFATGGTAAALACKSASSSVPVLFYIGGDAVGQGLVASLNRPGGNLTGFAWFGFALAAKRMELLHELLPKVTEIGMLSNPNNPDVEYEIREVQAAARTLGDEIRVFRAASPSDLESVFENMSNQRIGALFVGSDTMLASQRAQIVALAARRGIPAIYERRDYPDAGGLMSYGHNRVEAYRLLGLYAGRILKGEKPADLPAIQPTKFELVINMKTAKALGLTISNQMQLLTDEIIE